MKALPDKDITGKIIEAVKASADYNQYRPRPVSLKATSGRQPIVRNRQRTIIFSSWIMSNPPEPDRMVEALWRALHGSDAATPRIFSDRLKNFIGEESSQGNWLLDAQTETPAETFNQVFAKELREVQFSRGDKREGISQEEFDANVKNRELSDQEREEVQSKEGGRGESKKPEQEGGEVAPTPKVVIGRIDDALARMRERDAGNRDSLGLQAASRKARRISAGQPFNIKDVSEEAIEAVGGQIGKLTAATGLRREDLQARKMTPLPPKPSVADEAEAVAVEAKKQKGYLLRLSSSPL